MKILVTGSSGRLGTALVKELKKNPKYEVISYDIKTGGDILNYKQLKNAMTGVDIVVHAAAYPAPGLIPNLRKGFNLNIAGTFNVAEACKECGVKKLIFTSSTAYYGIERSLKRKLPLKEGNKPFFMVAQPNENYNEKEITYGVTKACSEALLSIYGLKKTFQVIILRVAPMGRVFLSLHLPLHKCVQGIMLAIEKKEPLWYKIFNLNSVGDLHTSEVEKILGFRR